MIIGKITGKTWDIHGTRLLGRFGNFPALGAPAAPWLSDDTWAWPQWCDLFESFLGQDVPTCSGARNHFRLHKNGTRSRWTIIPMFPRKRSWVEALEFQLDQHFMKKKSTDSSAMLQNPAVSPMEALAFRSCIIHIRYVSDSCEQLQDWPSNLMNFGVAQLLDQQQTCLPTSP